MLTIPSLTYIIGALAAGNPLASVGASREMKLIMSYELTFLLVMAAIIYKAGMAIRLHNIIAEQHDQGAFVGSISGVLLFVGFTVLHSGKTGFCPF